METTLQEKLTEMFREGTSPLSEFDQVLNKMSDIYHRKNHDYGDSFTKSCNEFGLTSPIIRMSDKLERLKTLAKQGSSARVEDEKIEDTLIDLANYAVMTILWIRNENKRKEGLGI